MHLLLTDILTCPRCGPSFGLILLAERLEDRRVLEGSLGCANCRERYPIRSGFADLRGVGRGPGPGDTLPGANPAPAPTPSSGEALRLAALLGLAKGGGQALLVGEVAMHARAIADLAGETEIAAAWDGAEAWPEEVGVSRLAVRGLPFADRSLRGVALTAESGIPAAEAARVVAPLGRLVLIGWPDEIAEPLKAAGFEALAAESGTLLAARLAAT